MSWWQLRLGLPAVPLLCLSWRPWLLRFSFYPGVTLRVKICWLSVRMACYSAASQGGLCVSVCQVGLSSASHGGPLSSRSLWRSFQALHCQVFGIREASYYRLMVLMTHVSHLSRPLTWRSLARFSLVLGSYEGMYLSVIKKVAMSR